MSTEETRSHNGITYRRTPFMGDYFKWVGGPVGGVFLEQPRGTGKFGWVGDWRASFEAAAQEAQEVQFKNYTNAKATVDAYEGAQK